MKKIIAIVLYTAFNAVFLSAQGFSTTHWSYNISAGLNYGGTAPFPIPVPVEKINSWRPGISPQVVAYATRWIKPNSHWGVSIGIGAAIKGMETSARVHLMHTELVLKPNEKLSGLFSGHNISNVRNGYILIPMQIAYRAHRYFIFKAGGYFAYTAQKSFSGSVTDGYLRIGSIIGDKMEIKANSYDFSSEIKSYDFGAMVNFQVHLLRKIYANMDFAWGLTSVLNKDFEGIAYDMYNIYLTVGGSCFF